MRQADPALHPHYLHLINFFENFVLKWARLEVFFGKEAQKLNVEGFLAQWDWEALEKEPAVKYTDPKRFCRILKLKVDGDGDGEAANTTKAMGFLVRSDLDDEDEDMDDAAGVEVGPMVQEAAPHPDDAMEDGPDSP
ncbi:MAG: hypothetical protein Q9174_006463 [Haloplaca sp. 1 TL-2023]